MSRARYAMYEKAAKRMVTIVADRMMVERRGINSIAWPQKGSVKGP